MPRSGSMREEKKAVTMRCLGGTWPLCPHAWERPLLVTHGLLAGWEAMEVCL